MDESCKRNDVYSDLLSQSYHEGIQKLTGDENVIPEDFEIPTHILEQRKKTWDDLFAKYASNNSAVELEILTLQPNEDEPDADDIEQQIFSTEDHVSVNNIDKQNVDIEICKDQYPEEPIRCTPMRKPMSVVQYWVNTNYLPYNTSNHDKSHSDSGTSLEEELLESDHSINSPCAIGNSSVEKESQISETFCNKHLILATSSSSSADTAAYILANNNRTKKSDTLAIVKGSKHNEGQLNQVESSEFIKNLKNLNVNQKYVNVSESKKVINSNSSSQNEIINLNEVNNIKSLKVSNLNQNCVDVCKKKEITFKIFTDSSSASEISNLDKDDNVKKLVDVNVNEKSVAVSIRQEGKEIEPLVSPNEGVNLLDKSKTEDAIINKDKVDKNSLNNERLLQSRFSSDSNESITLSLYKSTAQIKQLQESQNHTQSKLLKKKKLYNCTESPVELTPGSEDSFCLRKERINLKKCEHPGLQTPKSHSKQLLHIKFQKHNNRKKRTSRLLSLMSLKPAQKLPCNSIQDKNYCTKSELNSDVDVENSDCSTIIENSPCKRKSKIEHKFLNDKDKLKPFKIIIRRLPHTYKNEKSDVNMRLKNNKKLSPTKIFFDKNKTNVSNKSNLLSSNSDEIFDSVNKLFKIKTANKKCFKTFIEEEDANDYLSDINIDTIIKPIVNNVENNTRNLVDNVLSISETNEPLTSKTCNMPKNVSSTDKKKLEDIKGNDNFQKSLFRYTLVFSSSDESDNISISNNKLKSRPLKSNRNRKKNNERTFKNFNLDDHFEDSDSISLKNKCKTKQHDTRRKSNEKTFEKSNSKDQVEDSDFTSLKNEKHKTKHHHKEQKSNEKVCQKLNSKDYFENLDLKRSNNEKLESKHHDEKQKSNEKTFGKLNSKDHVEDSDSTSLKDENHESKRHNRKRKKNEVTFKKLNLQDHFVDLDSPNLKNENYETEHHDKRSTSCVYTAPKLDLHLLDDNLSMVNKIKEKSEDDNKCLKNCKEKKLSISSKPYLSEININKPLKKTEYKANRDSNNKIDLANSINSKLVTTINTKSENFFPINVNITKEKEHDTILQKNTSKFTIVLSSSDESDDIVMNKRKKLKSSK